MDLNTPSLKGSGLDLGAACLIYTASHLRKWNRKMATCIYDIISTQT